MNKEERQKLENHTGKKKPLSTKEQKKLLETAKAKKRETFKKWIISISAILLIFLIIFGVNLYSKYKDNKMKEAAINPPEVTMPTDTEIAEIKNEIVVLETTMGVIKIELYPEAAPLTVNNFRRLVIDGFYDGHVFHRVINDFMIQTGGFTSSQQADVRYTFKDEINPDSLGLSADTIKANETEGYIYDRTLKSIKLENGVVAMANAGPNTNGSQFFIITAKEEAQWLNGRHTGFGKVIAGMDVCNKIQVVEKNDADRPVKDVIINKAYIEKRQQ